VAVALIVVAGCGVGSGLVPSSTKVDFGNVVVGNSTSQLVTLTNTGKTNVSIAGVSAQGRGFRASGGSNVVLAPAQAVTVSVAFNPATAGEAQGTLFVTGEASSRLVTIELSGSGDASGRHSVTLSWQPSVSPVMGYFIYRSNAQSGARARLNASLENTTSYTDSTVAGGQKYLYSVTSVNSSNIESAASNQVTVTIPSP
jgi:hypothetical protein